MARRVFLLGFAVALLAAFGCSGGGDGGTISPAFVCIDAVAVAPHAVALACGGSTDGTTEQVNVVIVGPTSGTTTLRGLNFDVTYDPLLVEFVPMANYASSVFPPSAIVLAQLSDLPNRRVVVSLQQLGGVPDVVVGAGQHLVLSLFFRRVAGATFSPTSLTFDNSEATNASATISFAGDLALSYQ